MAETKTSVDVARIPNWWNQVSGGSAAGWNYSGTPQYTTVICSDTHTGTRNRAYKRLIAKGSNATTIASGTREEFRLSPAIEHIYGATTSSGTDSHRKAVGYWNCNISALPSLPPTTQLDLARNMAQTRFYKQLDEVMTAFQGGTFLGELRETLHMIRNPAKALRGRFGDYLDALKKGRRGSKKQKQKFLADTWLEYSFGWSPFLNDLEEAKTLLERRQEQLVQELIPVLGLGKAQSTSFSSQVKTDGVLNMRSLNMTVTESIVVYAGAVNSKASGTTLLDSAAIGLSPRSFVPTLWELAPWSFAIDYFTNVGDVISAWSNQNVGLSWGRHTEIRSALIKPTAQYANPDPALVRVFSHSYVPASGYASRRTFSRQPVTTVPVPRLAFELPGFGTKWLNIAALASTRKRLTPF